MYTNIDNQFGVEASTYWVSKDPNLLPRNISTVPIINSLKIVLEYNTFTFDTDYYIQIRGTAMGTKLAPAYATLVMGYLEIRLYQQVEEKYGINAKMPFHQKNGGGIYNTCQKSLGHFQNVMENYSLLSISITTPSTHPLPPKAMLVCSWGICRYSARKIFPSPHVLLSRTNII